MITATTKIPSLMAKTESDDTTVLASKMSPNNSNDSKLIESYLDFNNTLNLVLLDKFQGRSNISLILIQMKCDLQDMVKELASVNKSVTLDDPKFDSEQLKQLIKKQHSGLLYVFKRLHFWDVKELKEVYDQAFDGLPHCLKPTEILPFVYDGLDDIDLVLHLTTSIHDGSEFAWSVDVNDFHRFSDMVLCCSEALEAYQVFEHDKHDVVPHVVDHHKFSTIRHLLARSFSTSHQLKLHHDGRRSKSNTHESKINEANLKIVQSLKFKEFYCNRLEVLALDKKRVF